MEVEEWREIGLAALVEATEVEGERAGEHQEDHDEDERERGCEIAGELAAEQDRDVTHRPRLPRARRW